MPSSEEELVKYGDVDIVQSLVKEFPPLYEEKFTRHFYFIELKEQTSTYIDRDPHEFEVRAKKKKLPIKVERVLRGRYYITLDADKDVVTPQLDFYVAGIKLRENFKLGLTPAHASHTKMKLLKARKSMAKFELVLRDKSGNLVEAPIAPDIIPESDGSVEKVEHMGNGIWHISISYPQGNQLFYISVRSYGVFFKKLFRFQYVDK